MRLIALSGVPYAGKTTLVRELVKLGYMEINFGCSLKRMAANCLNQITGGSLTTRQIDMDKAKYRCFLQEFGNLIGFNDDQRFVKVALDAWEQNMRPAAVFDCVRAWEQFDVLEEYGFELVHVCVPHKVQWQRAQEAGVMEDEFNRLVNHPLEQGVGAVPDGRVVQVSGVLNPMSLAYFLAKHETRSE